jgi:hypothetical protein
MLALLLLLTTIWTCFEPLFLSTQTLSPSEIFHPNQIRAHIRNVFQTRTTFLQTPLLPLQPFLFPVAAPLIPASVPLIPVAALLISCCGPSYFLLQSFLFPVAAPLISCCSPSYFLLQSFLFPVAVLPNLQRKGYTRHTTSDHKLIYVAYVKDTKMKSFFAAVT